MGIVPPPSVREHSKGLVRLSLAFAIPAGITALALALVCGFHIMFLIWAVGGKPFGQGSDGAVQSYLELIWWAVRSAVWPYLVPVAAFCVYAMVRSSWTAFRELQHYAAYLGEDEAGVNAETRLWRHMLIRRCWYGLGSVLMWSLPFCAPISCLSVFCLLAAKDTAVPSWMFWVKPFSLDGEAVRFKQLEDRRRREAELLRSRGRSNSSDEAIPARPPRVSVTPVQGVKTCSMPNDDERTYVE